MSALLLGGDVSFGDGDGAFHFWLMAFNAHRRPHAAISRHREIYRRNGHWLGMLTREVPATSRNRSGANLRFKGVKPSRRLTKVWPRFHR